MIPALLQLVITDEGLGKRHWRLSRADCGLNHPGYRGGWSGRVVTLPQPVVI
jgi:hypothetical protein